MTVRYNGDFLGVKCDACGRIFWTNYQGQSFPQHINCGAPMTDEAVEMVMERMEALHAIDT